MNTVVRPAPQLTPAIRLLGLMGSLRRHSHSAAVMDGLEAALTPGIRIDVADIRLPLYNEDEDGVHTAIPVRRLRRAVAEADGVVIITPEYNHGIPGLLKNALDWASRPRATSPLRDKATLVVSHSTGLAGGMRAQAQVRDVLRTMQVRIPPGPEVIISNVHEKITDGWLTDEPTLEFAMDAIGRLVTAIRLGQRSLADAPAPSAYAGVVFGP